MLYIVVWSITNHLGSEFNEEGIRSEYQTLVLNDRSFGNVLAVSFFRRRARLRSRSYDVRYIIEKRCGKLGRYVSFNEIHVLYRGFE